MIFDFLLPRWYICLVSKILTKTTLCWDALSQVYNGRKDVFFLMSCWGKQSTKFCNRQILSGSWNVMKMHWVRKYQKLLSLNHLANTQSIKFSMEICVLFDSYSMVRFPLIPTHQNWSETIKTSQSIKIDHFLSVSYKAIHFLLIPTSKIIKQKLIKS